uniref:Uncharacterized protein n=1 Tax=Moniliophthora roreri TaxID=221103 RepID=A0A0W0FN11_MONRR
MLSLGIIVNLLLIIPLH